MNRFEAESRIANRIHSFFFNFGSKLYLGVSRVWSLFLLFSNSIGISKLLRYN